MILSRRRFALLFLALLVFASAASAAGLVFEAKDGPGANKHVVFITGEWAFRSEESFPMMAKILNTHHGFKTTVLFAINPEGDYVHPNYNKNIPGLETLKTADLVIIQTRWRDLPDEQLQHIADYVNAGKPIIGTESIYFRNRQLDPQEHTKPIKLEFRLGKDEGTVKAPRRFVFVGLSGETFVKRPGQ